MNNLSNNKNESILRTKTLDIICPQNIQKKNDLSLLPIEKSQQLQNTAYEQIRNLSAVLKDLYSEKIKKNLKEIFNEKQEIINKRIHEQHHKNIACLLSDLKPKYEIKRLKFINKQKDKFNKFNNDMNVNIKRRREEKLKQLVITMEKIAATNIENSLKATETYLKHEFGYVEEHNLLEYKEYYRQLIMYYQLKIKNNLDTMKKRHEESYKTLKNTIEEKNKNEYDSIKIEFQNKLQVQKSEIVPKLSVNRNDEKKKEMNKCFRRQLADKLNELNRSDQQLKFYKEKIKSVLNNYSNAVTLMEKQRFDYVLDKEKMFQKYLCHPTEDELKQLIHGIE